MILEKYDFSLESSIKESLFEKISGEFNKLYGNMREPVSLNQLLDKDLGKTHIADFGVSALVNKKDGRKR